MRGFQTKHLAALAWSETDTREFWEWSLDPDGETTVIGMVLHAGSIEALPFQQPWTKRDPVDPGQWHELDAERHGHEWKSVADL